MAESDLTPENTPKKPSLSERMEQLRRQSQPEARSYDSFTAEVSNTQPQTEEEIRQERLKRANTELSLRIESLLQGQNKAYFESKKDDNGEELFQDVNLYGFESEDDFTERRQKDLFWGPDSLPEDIGYPTRIFEVEYRGADPERILQINTPYGQIPEGVVMAAKDESMWHIQSYIIFGSNGNAANFLSVKKYLFDSFWSTGLYSQGNERELQIPEVFMLLDEKSNQYKSKPSKSPQEMRRIGTEEYTKLGRVIEGEPKEQDSKAMEMEDGDYEKVDHFLTEIDKGNFQKV